MFPAGRSGSNNYNQRENPPPSRGRQWNSFPRGSNNRGASSSQSWNNPGPENYYNTNRQDDDPGRSYHQNRQDDGSGRSYNQNRQAYDENPGRSYHQNRQDDGPERSHHQNRQAYDENPGRSYHQNRQDDGRGRSNPQNHQAHDDYSGRAYPRRHYGRRSPPPYQNGQNSRGERYNHGSSRPPYPRGGGWNTNVIRTTKDEAAKESYMISLEQKLTEYERKEKERKLQEEWEEQARGQRFGAYGEDDNSDSSTGGAPVHSKKSKKKKKKSETIKRSSSGSSSSDDQKNKYSDDDEDDRYKYLDHINYRLPQIFTHRKPEKPITEPPDFNFWIPTKPAAKIHLDDDELKQETVEYCFPYKAPTEHSPGLIYIEGAPYDPKNDASVAVTAQEADIDWSTVPFEDFIAMDILQQGIFAQSSATKKSYVYKMWLRSATTKERKVECYLKLIKLEDERVEESRKSGRLTGKFDIHAVKMEMVKEGLKNSGEDVDLRLVEIELLTEKYGENSEEVKVAWQKMMSKFPNDLKMWRRRLTFYRNKRSLFKAKSYITDSLLPCLNKLGGILNHTFKSHPKQVGTEDFLVDVIVSIVSLYIEMGCTYKAIGILQAMVEFYMLTPHPIQEDNKYSFDQKLKAFKFYWQSNVPKAGESLSPGWALAKSNFTYDSYNFKENKLIEAEDEKKVHEAAIRNMIVEDSKNCKRFLTSTQKWAYVEKERTQKLWRPLYNSQSNPLVFCFYNSFDDIKPYLLQIDQSIAQSAVFKILMKFGAVIPSQKNFSQEAIFHRCKAVVYDASFKMEYSDMFPFIDNMLLLMSGSDILFYTIARIMSYIAFILETTKTFTEARRQLGEFCKRVIKEVATRYRDFDQSEYKIITSYQAQLNAELFFRLTKKDVEPLATLPDNQAQHFMQSDILDKSNNTMIDLLASLRCYVMFCRNLPHHSELHPSKNMTKLKFLLKLSNFGEERIDINSETVRSEAIEKWIRNKLHTKGLQLPSSIQWIGNITALALELFATLCYESQVLVEKKFDDFKKCFNDKILKENENLTEVYFKTWDHYLQVYLQEKCGIIESLKKFMDIFPRNDYLTKLYVKHLPSKAMEARYFFSSNTSEDDVVKILRNVIEVSSAFETIQTNKNVRKTNFAYFYEILRKAAELSLTSLIPETFLWQCLLFVVKETKASNFHTSFLIANDQCPWSKTLLIYCASYLRDPKFLEAVEAFANEAGVELLTTGDDIKHLK